MLLQERNVLEEELLLQIFCAGGNHDALAGEDRGDKIGERFAGACAGFDDQMLLFAERGFDGFGHFQLACAEFVVGMPFRKQSLAAKELADGEGFDCGRHLQADSTKHAAIGQRSGHLVN